MPVWTLSQVILDYIHAVQRIPVLLTSLATSSEPDPSLMGELDELARGLPELSLLLPDAFGRGWARGAIRVVVGEALGRTGKLAAGCRTAGYVSAPLLSSPTPTSLTAAFSAARERRGVRPREGKR